MRSRQDSPLRDAPATETSGQAAFGFVGWVILAAAVAFQLVSSLAAKAGVLDDAMALVGADLVLKGKLPLVDFQSIYPPFMDYLFAGAFHFFARTILVQKALSAALYVWVIVAIAGFFRARFAHLRSLVPLMALPLALIIGAFMTDASWPEQF